ncbi:MAG: response regulator [Elusimicrobia bacterium]|nr:response regulator [Elusimicrobiota bacterium]
MRILIVDDDKVFKDLVEEVLKEAGYEILSAEDGLAGWKLLKEKGADMAVLDVNMPVMTGFQLLNKIRGNDKFKNIPVLMLTIRAFAEDQIQGYEIGADDYLTKPFSNDILVAKIKVLERRIIK